MADKLGFVIKVNKIGKMTAALTEKLALAVDETAKSVEARAKGGAPVDTGFLRNSIESHMTGPLTAEVNVGAEYGAYVNFGTRFTAPRPFFTQAVERERVVFPGRVAEALKAAAE